MNRVIITCLALVAVIQAAPQIRFTAREYDGLQRALGPSFPVAIQSAIRVLATAESNPTDFYVLNFNGLSGGKPFFSRTGPVASAVARTGSAAADNDVAEIFREVVEEANEDVREAAEDHDEDNEVDEEDGVNRTGLADVEEEDAVNEVTPLQLVAALENERRKRQDEPSNQYANTLSFALQFLGLELVPKRKN